MRKYLLAHMQVFKYPENMKNDTTSIGSPIEVFTRHMFTQVVQKLSAFLANSDFTLSEIAALHILDGQAGLPVQVVADKLGLSISATSRLTAELENKKLIRKQEALHDSRIKLLTCTKEGTKLLDQLSLQRAEAAYQVIHELPPEISKKILSALSENKKGGVK